MRVIGSAAFGFQIDMMECKLLSIRVHHRACQSALRTGCKLAACLRVGGTAGQHTATYSLHTTCTDDLHFQKTTCLQDNWLHADLHPGNIIVQTHAGPDLPPWLEAPADAAARAVLGVPLRQCLRSISFAIVDVGMVSCMQRHHFAALVDVYRGLAAFDGVLVADAMVRLRHEGGGSSVCDAPRFRAEVRDIFGAVDAEVMHERTHEVVGRVLDSMRRNRLTLDGAVSTTLITVLTLEGWASKLDPNIRILDTIKRLLPQPWARRVDHAVAVGAQYDLMDLA